MLLLSARRTVFDVKLWDAPVLNLDFEHLLKELEAYGADMVVVNTSTASFDYDVEFIEIVR